MLRKKFSLLVSLLLITGISGFAQRDTGDSKSGNRLAAANSPYLQQHADNPVDWHEWGGEALARAAAEDKPLLISVGYAACHWCHVMEEESFMDPVVARVMNEHFINIKVDREERPDVDQVYLTAAQLVSGSGGWPLNAFALPDGRPFYAGTYFERGDWLALLERIVAIYRNDRARVTETAEKITAGIAAQDELDLNPEADTELTREAHDLLWEQWQGVFDPERGGLAGAPKFPNPPAWSFLLQYHYLTGNDRALEAVTTTLDAMARGGLYDHLGGGFARYAVDEAWAVPHFEKMLYDNGQLVSLYAQAYQVTGNEAYARVVRETLAFVERELTSPEGAFYASINADSEGEEGTFYVWTWEEVEGALEAESFSLLARYYQLDPDGNWEDGKNILRARQDPATFAREQGIPPEQWADRLAGARERLNRLRNQRIRPTTDDKVLAGWNALMLRGYLDAYLALGEEDYLAAALRNARFLEEHMLAPDGRLWRTYTRGERAVTAFLDDHAFLAEAFIALYQATFDVHWLNRARALVDHAIDHFREDSTGMFYYTSDQTENLAVRRLDLADHVMPASNSAMAHALHQLGTYFYDSTYLAARDAMLRAMLPTLTSESPYYAHWAKLLGQVTGATREVAILGPGAGAVLRKLRRAYLPTALFMGGEAEDLPLLENKLIEGQTTIYVCQDRVCRLPVTDLEQALRQLAR